MTITMQAVKSSQIEAIGHDDASETLAIQFKGGMTYHYANVEKYVFDAMLKVESKGKFFATYIKSRPDMFPFTRQARVVAPAAKAAPVLTKEQAELLCEMHDIHELFDDEEGEEATLLRKNNPELLEAYRVLYLIATTEGTSS